MLSKMLLSDSLPGEVDEDSATSMAIKLLVFNDYDGMSADLLRWVGCGV